jgi:hypothetical protein
LPGRPPDWLIYLGAVALLLGAVTLSQIYGGPPPPETAGPTAGGASRGASRALPPPSPFDPSIIVDAPAAAPGAGTAFSVSPGGIWLTARHVVEGCARTAIVVGRGQGVAAEVRIDPAAETAVLITQGGAPALPMAPRQSLRRGMLAFHPGFPGGRPGEVASRLVRREILVVRGRRVRREPVLAWARADGGSPAGPSLAGLSGGPALDSQGRVVGVTIAQSRRRGRVYTTTPGALRAALARAHVELATGARGRPMDDTSFHRISGDLRRRLSVAPVVCLGG